MKVESIKVVVEKQGPYDSELKRTTYPITEKNFKTVEEAIEYLKNLK